MTPYLISKLNTLFSNYDVSADQQHMLLTALNGMNAAEAHRTVFLLESDPTLLQKSVQLFEAIDLNPDKDKEELIESQLV